MHRILCFVLASAFVAIGSAGCARVPTSDVEAEVSCPASPSCTVSSQTILAANRTLIVGSATFEMQNDGNFVIYEGGSAVWAVSMMPENYLSGYTGPGSAGSCDSCYAVLQSDGNFVLYNPQFSGNAEHAYWASYSGGNSEATFVLSESSPYVEIVGAGNAFLWSSSKAYGTPACGAPGSTTPLPGCAMVEAAGSNYVLNAGQSIEVGNATFAMGSDGDFVVSRGGAAVWKSASYPGLDVNGFTGPTSGLSCATCRAVFQGDGNFVLYRRSGAYWATGTGGHESGRFDLSQFAPYIELTTPSGALMWSSSGASSQRFVGELSQTDPMTWLIKSVCVNANNVVLQVDPADGCPPGTTVRKIHVGEDLPYYNRDDYDLEVNNFPVITHAGQTLVIDAREVGPPYDHVFRSHDQFDVYAVDVAGDGWVSAPNTRDGGGFNTTFFGPNCEVGGGWKLFPQSGFASGGQTSLTIAGQYWQQAGEAFPGTCTSVAATDAISTWSYLPQHTFKANTGPSKSLDTIQSVHGYQPNDASFTAYGHIETFYFTREYGLTRWETWSPIQQKPNVDNADCGVLPNGGMVTYQGAQFVISACFDVSDVALAVDDLLVPIWPVPNMNLLSHANFDSAGGYLPSSDTSFSLWHRVGTSPAGNLINWSLERSTSALDTQYGHVGVNYLITNCGAGSNGLCNTNEQIYQDLPISDFVSGQYYSYGFSGRVDESSGMSATGKLTVTISQLDVNDRVLWSSMTTTPSIGTDDGSNPNSLLELGNKTFANENTSVFLASGFYPNRVQMPIQSGAVRVRFAITPETPQNFDLLEAWFAPW